MASLYKKFKKMVLESDLVFFNLLFLDLTMKESLLTQVVFARI